jgi:hypothetical protein
MNQGSAALPRRNLLLFRMKTTYRYLRDSPSIVLQNAYNRLFNNTVGRLTAGRRLGMVAMLHLGRTGSTVLGDLLNQHPKILWDSEIYYRFLIGYANHQGEALEAWRQEAFHELPKRVARSGARYYGFEVQFFHMRYLNRSVPDYLDYLRTSGVTHYILLERRNHLRSLISYAVSEVTRRKFITQPSQKPALTKVHLDVNRITINGENCTLIEYLDRYADNYQTARRLLADQKLLYLNYEDDIERDPSNAALKTFEFLKLPGWQLEVHYKKTTPYPVSQVIENFDEVQAALRDTPYAWMVSE